MKEIAGDEVVTAVIGLDDISEPGDLDRLFEVIRNAERAYQEAVENKRRADRAPAEAQHRSEVLEVTLNRIIHRGETVEQAKMIAHEEVAKATPWHLPG